VDVVEFEGVLWMRALGPSQTAALARAASADFRRTGVKELRLF